MIELFYLKIRIYDWLIERATRRRDKWEKRREALTIVRDSNFKLDLDDEDTMENAEIKPNRILYKPKFVFGNEKRS